MTKDRKHREQRGPRPPEIHEARQLCAEMRKRIDRLERDYVEAYEAAHSSGGAGIEGRSTIGESNPTLNVATAKAKRALRGSLWSIFEQAKDGAALFLAAAEGLEKAMERAHGSYSFTEAQRMGRGELAGDFRRTAKDSDIAEARAAQVRRQARGEI